MASRITCSNFKLLGKFRYDLVNSRTKDELMLIDTLCNRPTLLAEEAGQTTQVDDLGLESSITHVWVHLTHGISTLLGRVVPR